MYTQCVYKVCKVLHMISLRSPKWRSISWDGTPFSTISVSLTSQVIVDQSASTCMSNSSFRRWRSVGATGFSLSSFLTVAFSAASSSVSSASLVAFSAASSFASSASAAYCLLLHWLPLRSSIAFPLLPFYFPRGLERG